MTTPHPYHAWDTADAMSASGYTSSFFLDGDVVKAHLACGAEQTNTDDRFTGVMRHTKYIRDRGPRLAAAPWSQPIAPDFRSVLIVEGDHQRGQRSVDGRSNSLATNTRRKANAADLTAIHSKPLQQMRRATTFAISEQYEMTRVR